MGGQEGSGTDTNIGHSFFLPLRGEREDVDLVDLNMASLSLLLEDLNLSGKKGARPKRREHQTLAVRFFILSPFERERGIWCE